MNNYRRNHLYNTLTYTRADQGPMDEGDSSSRRVRLPLDEGQVWSEENGLEEWVGPRVPSLVRDDNETVYILYENGSVAGKGPGMKYFVSSDAGVGDGWVAIPYTSDLLTPQPVRDFNRAVRIPQWLSRMLLIRDTQLREGREFGRKLFARISLYNAAAASKSLPRFAHEGYVENAFETLPTTEDRGFVVLQNNADSALLNSEEGLVLEWGDSTFLVDKGGLGYYVHPLNMYVYPRNQNAPFFKPQLGAMYLDAFSDVFPVKGSLALEDQGLKRIPLEDAWEVLISYEPPFDFRRRVPVVESHNVPRPKEDLNRELVWSFLWKQGGFRAVYTSLRGMIVRTSDNGAIVFSKGTTFYTKDNMEDALMPYEEPDAELVPAWTFLYLFQSSEPFVEIIRQGLV